MSIRQAEERDLAAVAAIHKAQFSDHFLGKYSQTLLAEFYRTFLDQTIFLVYESPEGIGGFVMGGEADELAQCNSSFMHNNIRRCIIETSFHPTRWRVAIHHGLGYLRAILFVNRRPAQSSAISDMSLLSIAVKPNLLGTGIAAQLINAFGNEILKRQRIDYRLSVNKHNLRAISFYKKMGFNIVGQNQKCLLFQKSVSPTTDHPCQLIE